MLAVMTAVLGANLLTVWFVAGLWAIRNKPASERMPGAVAISLGAPLAILIVGLLALT